MSSITLCCLSASAAVFIGNFLYQTATLRNWNRAAEISYFQVVAIWIVWMSFVSNNYRISQ